MEQELTRLLNGLLRQRPQAQPRDFYKLLYQREFGCGHLAPTPESAERLLREELAQKPAERADGSPKAQPPGSVEPIGNGLCRIYLDGAWSEEAVRLLTRIFLATANTHIGDAARFHAALDALCRWASGAMDAPDAAALCETVEALRAEGCPAVHHSAAYRAAYAPHYRVARRCYVDAWPALLLAQRVKEQAAPGTPALLAVDGRCGSGKSTLARLLSEVFGCPIFRLDDFFLPPALRTGERLSHPGENVHHERFLREVLEPFKAGQLVRFCPFDCSVGAMGEAVEAAPAPFAVVEGSYALHPALRAHYAASVFVTCAPEIQRARILAREGADALAVFARKWIPLEEAYFRAYNIPALADLTLDTTDFYPQDVPSRPPAAK